METLTMKQDFTYNFAVNASAKETMEAISQVNLWWAKKFKGEASKLNDEFSVYFGGPEDTFVNFKISEVIPGKKVVWLVTDCNLHWLSDKKEWNGTRVVWDINPLGNATEIVMTHIGLVPESECYDDCYAGWTGHIKGSLYKLLSEGAGQPE